ASAVDRASAAPMKEEGPALPATSREKGEAPNQQLKPIQTGAPASGGSTAQASVDEQFRETIQRMQSLAETVETSQRGHATFYPLMALAKAQAGLEGRKAILFFSEGLQVPSSVEEVFQATISEANRANVSVYAIDSRGLDTSRGLEAAGAALDKAGRVSQQAMAKRGAGGTSMDEVQNDDLVLSSFKSSTQSVLRELAEDTGGALIANTNDLAKGLDRVTADL